MPEMIAVRQASDGYAMSYRRAQPAGPPRGWVVMLHGIQSHSGWYGMTRERLAAIGFDVTFPDRRGSGLNAVDRGHAPHWKRLVNDVVHFLNDARFERDRDNPSAPVILGGLSWGGRLAYAVARLRPELMDGLVLLYPGIINFIGPTWVDLIGLKIAEQLGIDRRYVAVPLNDTSLFTSDPDRQQFIGDDALAVREVTTGFLAASGHLEGICRSSPERQLHRPTLLMLAGDDQIVDNLRTRSLLERHHGQALSVVEFPRARHTLEFEPCQEEYLQRLTGWLEDRSERS
jgi:alpha-beta hydrolase superfamily lysophospholipase